MAVAEGSGILDGRASGQAAIVYLDVAKNLMRLDGDLKDELEQLEQISIAHGTLHINDPHTNKRLQQLVSDVLSVEPVNASQIGGYIKVPSDGPDDMLISVFPYFHFPVDDAHDYKVYAEVRITYPKLTNLTVFSRAMRDLYDLSASESRVVSLLVQGRNTKEIASSLHVADSTLRTHLKRIFSKTGTRHQAELVSKVLLRDTHVMPNVFV